MSGPLARALIYAMPVVAIGCGAVILREKFRLEDPGLFRLNLNRRTIVAHVVLFYYFGLLLLAIGQGW